LFYVSLLAQPPALPLTRLVPVVPIASSLSPQAYRRPKTPLEISRATWHTRTQPWELRRDTGECIRWAGPLTCLRRGPFFLPRTPEPFLQIGFCGPSYDLFACGQALARRAVRASCGQQLQAIANSHVEGRAITEGAQLQRAGDLRAVGHRRQTRRKDSAFSRPGPGLSSSKNGGRTRGACAAS